MKLLPLDRLAVKAFADVPSDAAETLRAVPFSQVEFRDSYARALEVVRASASGSGSHDRINFFIGDEVIPFAEFTEQRAIDSLRRARTKYKGRTR